jgi:hypothetical protein
LVFFYVGNVEGKTWVYAGLGVETFFSSYFLQKVCINTILLELFNVAFFISLGFDSLLFVKSDSVCETLVHAIRELKIMYRRWATVVMVSNQAFNLLLFVSFFIWLISYIVQGEIALYASVMLFSKWRLLHVKLEVSLKDLSALQIVID